MPTRAVSANRETELSQTSVNSNGNFKHEFSAKHHLPRLRTLYIHAWFNERGEGRKKEASKVIQTTRQRNTAHPRQSSTTVARKGHCVLPKMRHFQIAPLPNWAKL